MGSLWPGMVISHVTELSVPVFYLMFVTSLNFSDLLGKILN